MRMTPYDMIKRRLRMCLSEELLEKIPRRWEILGEVVVVKLVDELGAFFEEIGQVYAEVLGCRSVVRDLGDISGVFREPKVEVIWGDKDTETVHVENGVRFRLDPQRVMFSSGNMAERKRMGLLVDENEQVADLCAGIGYFSVPMAVHGHPRVIRAHEINPVAYRYLVENVKLNKVGSIVQPVLGDCRKTYTRDWADRVVVGYFGDSIEFLPVVVDSLKCEGGWIHFHDIFVEEKIPDVVFQMVKDVVVKRFSQATLVSWRVVKSYAPGIDHVVLDVRVW